MIQARDQIAGRHLQSAIRVFRNPEIFGQPLDAEFVRRAFPSARSVSIVSGRIRAAVDHAQFPVVVGLRRHRREHLLQIIRRRVMHRHEQADLGCASGIACDACRCLSSAAASGSCSAIQAAYRSTGALAATTTGVFSAAARALLGRAQSRDCAATATVPARFSHPTAAALSAQPGSGNIGRFSGRLFLRR